MNAVNRVTLKQKWKSYRRNPLSLMLFIAVCLAAVISIASVVLLVGYILFKGIPNLSPELFAWKYTSENVSLMPALINTLVIVAVSLLIAVPIGIGSAIYLAEYAKRGNKLVSFIRLTTETLSGIPSIIYGLFGALFFVERLGFNKSIASGACTLAIMILPTVIRTTEEALIAVPDSYREGSFGLGAGKLRTVMQIVLPSAIPGIFSGIILSIGRIVGESAALIYTAGTLEEAVTGLSDSGITLSVHMYKISTEALYMKQAYATAVVLLVIVVGINALSDFLAVRLGKGRNDG